MLLSGLVYKYKCADSNATYYGKTNPHFKVWICEHLGISHLIEKQVKIDNNKRQSKNTFYIATTLHLLKTFPF